MSSKGYLVLETGDVFSGKWNGGTARAGEIVFNTSHSGYEEMATDPSYFSQILVASAPMQGNYGVDDEVWESSQVHIRGFVCLEIQNTSRENSWLKRLTHKQVPVLSEVDTRALILTLREKGTTWGAIVEAEDAQEALGKSKQLIEQARKKEKDWVNLVSVKEPTTFKGQNPQGPRIAVMDFGSKMNIIRELQQRCSEVCMFPSRTSAAEIMEWSPDGLMLTNGPGDPADVEHAPQTVRELVGKLPIFGICMGHQILSLALGFETFKLRFGHRGSNHPVKDLVLNKVYMTAQNHGYAVRMPECPLPNAADIKITHVNLNDNTVSGIKSESLKCLSVQFHPESHPGPNDAALLFDYFMKEMVRG
ncbi:MAG: glutamine-hydrolyzing carbamoyl-phosphate synthase small subunit [Bdellovibrionaceae bacterium]|nr:glutamine-hydrolyzing carbamoyl-phosphate synthase small subunit [Pseudobdellovibrionaceae bacterium]